MFALHKCRMIGKTHIGDSLRTTLGLAFLFVLFFTPRVSAQSYNQKTISVYFPSNGDQLNAESKSVIRTTFLEIQPRIIREIYVEGHTDSDASLSYNQGLSNRRASNTQEYLMSQGVRQSIIQIGAFGESQPISTKKNKNRRVLITMVYEDEPNPPLVTEVKSGDAKYIKIVTYNAKTKSRLPCNYVIERNAKNLFARTNSNATCIFDRKRFPNVNVTFSKSGFLNQSLMVQHKDVHQVGDTLSLKVYLKPVAVIQKLRYDHIYFYTDTDRFKPEAKQELEKLVAILTENPKLYVEIQGHMNFSETRQANILQRIYNHDLSHKRAKAVYLYLIAQRIDKKRLTYKGLSNFRMIFPNPANDSEADRNKRVEVWTLQLLAGT
ncbi:MAG: outer membrane protein OmpA-like peptidoglycan-associated protein [Bacteroidia bacterium]|jgi:outer membrane protein OmpA-like peptidoglycan-associated protein